MTHEYQVRVYSSAGVLQAVLDMSRDVRTIVIEHRVNHVSTLTLSLESRADAVQYFELDSIVQVLRKWPEADLDWYTEFVGFHRTTQKQITEADNRIFTSYCRGFLDHIKRRHIRYYADTAGSAKGPAPADDVIKEYVRENAGSLATTANGRVTNGVTSGLTVAPDTSEAPTHEGAGAWENLLDHIRKIGEPHGVDFEVEWGGASAPTTFVFRTHYPQLGTDRREGTDNPTIFSTSLGNMASPSYTQQRTEEVTSVLVLGPGEGPLRDTTLVTSAHIADSPWNTIEHDLDASSEDRATALTQAGEDLLYQKRPAVSLPFGVIQNHLSAYGKHFFLGDLVTGKFDDVSSDVKIRAITLTLSEARENISLELEEIA